MTLTFIYESQVHRRFNVNSMYAPNSKDKAHASSRAAAEQELNHSNAAANRAVGGKTPAWMSGGASRPTARASRQVNNSQLSHNNGQNHTTPFSQESTITPPPSPPLPDPPTLFASTLNDFLGGLDSAPNDANACPTNAESTHPPLRQDETITSIADRNAQNSSPPLISTLDTLQAQTNPAPSAGEPFLVRDLPSKNDDSVAREDTIATNGNGGMGDPIVIDEGFSPNLPPTPQASETATTPETGSPRWIQHGTTPAVTGPSSLSRIANSLPVNPSTFDIPPAKRRRIQGDYANIPLNPTDGVIVQDSTGKQFFKHRNGFFYAMPTKFSMDQSPSSQPPRRSSMPAPTNQNHLASQISGATTYYRTSSMSSNNHQSQTNRSVSTATSHPPSNIQQVHNQTTNTAFSAATVPQPSIPGSTQHHSHQHPRVAPRPLPINTTASPQLVYRQDGQMIQSPIAYYPGQQSPAIQQTPQQSSVPPSPAHRSLNYGVPQSTHIVPSVMASNPFRDRRIDMYRLIDQLHAAVRNPQQIGIDPRTVNIAQIDHRLIILKRAVDIDDFLCLCLQQLLCYYHLGMSDRLPAKIRSHPGLAESMQILGSWFHLRDAPADQYISNHLMGRPMPLDQFAMDYSEQFIGFQSKTINLLDRLPSWSGRVLSVKERRYPLLPPEFIQDLGLASCLLMEAAMSLLLRNLSRDFDPCVQMAFQEQGLTIFRDSINQQTPDNILEQRYLDMYYAFVQSGQIGSNVPTPTQPQFQSASILTNVSMVSMQPHQRISIHTNIPNTTNTNQPSHENQSPITAQSRGSMRFPNNEGARPHAQSPASRLSTQHSPNLGNPQTPVSAPHAEGAGISANQIQTQPSQNRASANNLQGASPEVIIKSTCAVLPRLIREMDAEHEDDAPLSNIWRQLAVQLQATITNQTCSHSQTLIPPATSHPSTLPVKRNIVAPLYLVPTNYTPLLESRVAETHEKTLHQLDLMSPILGPQDVEMAGNSGVSMCQFVSSFALHPSTLTVGDHLTHNINFWVFKSDHERISKSLSPVDGKNNMGVNVINVGKNTLQYRIRCIQVAKSSPDTKFELSKWLGFDMTCPTWMELSLNNKHLEARRKPQYGHFKKDMPFIVSDYITPGSNLLEVSLNTLGDEVGSVSMKRGKPTDHWIAVEAIELLTPTAINEMAKSKSRPKDNVLRELKRQFSTSTADDSEIITLSTDKIISVRDPFTSTLISETPVRSVNCRHNECFSLEYFIQSRPKQAKPYDHYGTKDVPKGSATQVDVWSCPICSADARPTELFVDEWMVGIRSELVKRGRKDAAAIKVNEHGNWEIREETVGSEEQAIVKVAKVDSNRSNGGTPVIISLLDDD